MTNTTPKGKPDIRKPFRQKILGVAAVLSLTVMPALAFAGDTSDATVIWLHPERYRMWSTAESRILTVQWTFPATATRATLNVEGYKFTNTFANLSTNSVEVEFPAALDSTTERAYLLTLAFNDGTEKKAVIGNVCGVGGASSTLGVSVKDDPTAETWGQFKSRAVTFPIPAGTEEVTVNDVSVPVVANGTPSWYTLAPVISGTSVDVAVEGAEATLTAQGSGVLLIFK